MVVVETEADEEQIELKNSCTLRHIWMTRNVNGFREKVTMSSVVTVLFR